MPGPKAVNLGHLNLQEEEDISNLESALWGRGLESLEELCLESNYMGSPGLEIIIGALTEGACPLLQRLDLSCNSERFGGHRLHKELGQVLAEAFRSGYCRHLQELRIRDNNLGVYDGAVAMMRALQGGYCPQVVKLDLSYCNLYTEGACALAMALRSMAGPKLEELDLCSNSMMLNEGWAAIFGAMEAGCCLTMRRLDVHSCTLGTVASTALAQAITSGNCHGFQHLDLCNAFAHTSSTLRVLQAIQETSLRDLRFLNLGSTMMSGDHGRVLGEAIENGAVPKLELLALSNNESLGDEGVAPVMAGLEAGGCVNLRELYLYNVNMHHDGGHALARALASDQLRRLEELGIGHGYRLAKREYDHHVFIGDGAMVEVIRGLRHCPRLTFLDLHCTGMEGNAGEALVKMLREVAWPELNKLIITQNPHLLIVDSVEQGLVAVLQEGHLPRLERLSVDASDFRGWSGTRGLLRSAIEEKTLCPKLSVDWVGSLIDISWTVLQSLKAESNCM